MAQLDLFGEPSGADAKGSDDPVGLAPLEESVATTASRLPWDLRLGTSSWSFPGWEGLVWDRSASQRVLARHGLAAGERQGGLDRCVAPKGGAACGAHLSADLWIDGVIRKRKKYF